MLETLALLILGHGKLFVLIVAITALLSFFILLQRNRADNHGVSEILFNEGKQLIR